MYRAEFAKYNGKIPFLEFLHSLPKVEQIEIVAAIDKFLDLKNLNNRIPEKLSKFLRDGIFEIRVMHSNKISRSLYFYEKDKTVLFTNGFIKKSQKTPSNAIDKAIEIKKHHQNIEN